MSEAVASQRCGETEVECVRAGDESRFLDIMASKSTSAANTFLVFPDAQLDHLDIVERDGDELHFLAGSELVGTRQSTGAQVVDRGVVNIVRSDNLTILGLNASNEFQYDSVTPTTEDTQSSTALNIVESHNIELVDTQLASNGKTTLWVHGGSSVNLSQTEVDCYYFCVGVLASDFESVDLTANQYNAAVPGDKHAMMWVSSSLRTDDGRFFGGTNVLLEDTTINKRSGEGIFVGNGRYDQQSNVRVTGTTTINASSFAASIPDAWVSVHPNYFGVNVELEGQYPVTTDITESPADFGKFVLHSFSGSGFPPYQAPLTVCDQAGCLSTNDIANGQVTMPVAVEQNEPLVQTPNDGSIETPPIVEEVRDADVQEVAKNSPLTSGSLNDLFFALFSSNVFRRSRASGRFV